MKRIVLTLVAMMCCMLASPTTEAEPDKATLKLAKSHYENGNAAYNLRKFDEAISWFTKAYEVWPAPDFLYNIAQSYRLAGNCNQALLLYRRYLWVKERDKGVPFSKEERAEIEHFIKELTDCEVPPNSPPAPPLHPPSPPTNPPPPREPVGNAPGVSASTIRNAKLLSAYATGGIAVFSLRGNLSMPVQPSLAVGAGYPLSVGLLTLDVGARASYSPIRYDAMNGATLASLIGIRVTVGTTYQVNTKLGVRSDAGIGVARLRGLAEGNPFTDTGKAGAFTMLSFRVGVAAEYAITPNLVATIAPFSLGFTPAPDALVIKSLTQFDVLLGVGYRM